MIAENQFQTQLLALADAQPQELDFLKALNQKGRDAFSVAPFPTRKTELWKYTSLFNLSQIEFQQARQHSSNPELEQAATIAQLDSARLVFINGKLDPALSDALALEQVTLFSQANAAQQQIISQKLGSVLAQQQGTGHLFNDLNNASTQDGVLIHLGKDQQLSTPIQLSFLTTAEAQPVHINLRILVVLEQGAQATLVEHYQSDSSTQQSLTNALTEIIVGNNAKLQHYRLQTLQDDGVQHIGAVHTDLLRDAQYQAFFFTLGSQLVRNDLVVNHQVGGSHSELSGVYVPQRQQLVDYHTTIEHRASHCTSNEVFRGIMKDKAKAVFNGRIHIHPQAQKTLAELNNKNLLLNPGAEINTKPELEIYADDVKCAHGATVAQLDEQALFYLQSRGISKNEAELMLSFGFINELLDALPDVALTQYLRPLIAQQFDRNEVEL